eukprot:9491956-Pyramimonas_sp.AAC.1
MIVAYYDSRLAPGMSARFGDVVRRLHHGRCSVQRPRRRKIRCNRFAFAGREGAGDRGGVVVVVGRWAGWRGSRFAGAAARAGEADRALGRGGHHAVQQAGAEDRAAADRRERALQSRRSQGGFDRALPGPGAQSHHPLDGALLRGPHRLRRPPPSRLPAEPEALQRGHYARVLPHDRRGQPACPRHRPALGVPPARVHPPRGVPGRAPARGL